MCICFIYINNDPSVFPYRLCVAANRDEFFHRAARPIHIWDPPDQDILGGTDLTPGKENGTWMALNKRNGKIGILLNIRDPTAKQTVFKEPKLGRGTLIPEFLRSRLTTAEYATSVLSHSDHYDPFLLLMLELGNDGAYTGTYVMNTGPKAYHEFFVKSGGSSVFGFSNTYPNRPLLKVISGLEAFEDIFKRGCNQSESEAPPQDIIDNLLHLLSSEKRHLPDDTLDWSFPPESSLEPRERLSCIFVNVHEKNYGTRTQTLLFVDFDGNGFCLEKNTIPPQMRITSSWLGDTSQVYFHVENQDKSSFYCIKFPIMG